MMGMAIRNVKGRIDYGTARVYICTHCGSVQNIASDILDTGTTFTCMQCGKDTVVVLMRSDDYRANTDLLEACKAMLRMYYEDDWYNDQVVVRVKTIIERVERKAQ